MTEPVFHIRLRSAVQECLAAKIMTETVKPPMLKADLARGCREPFRERLNDFADQDCSDRVGLHDPSSRTMENAPISRVVSLHGGQNLNQVRMDRDRAVTPSFGRSDRT